MKTTEYKDAQPAQLQKRLAELRREHLDLRMRLATKQLANTAELRRVRRDVARVLTHLRAVAVQAIETEQ